ncbi:MAG: hypothetical protein P8O16_16315 [Algoriphagus sp.]|uniref:hypothetical protein n=1 Tax=Algoriphagus sp. TaxID=1872435 RepID=UPI00261092C9|nr:hypothetical protein [Algoriphagus sp.]MDG1278847.1 hypothetical protein [Algoriphagus sp.]
MDYILVNNEAFYKITNSDSLRPFFMSIVSDSNHWMFIASNGGLTAGRKNNNFALFPYYSDDKITDSYDITGSKSVFRIHQNGEKRIWEPFSDRYTGVYDLTRNLYKSEFGNKIIFEEINHDLGLSFQYSWNSSNKFGFVRKCKLVNNSKETLKVELVDGIQNVLPYGVDPGLQQSSSNLIDAYKKTELIGESHLGLFTLSAIIVDKAEPSEALKANVAWSLGLDHSEVLLSSLQLDHFRKGLPIKGETDVRAERGAYFVLNELSLTSGEEKTWMTLADVNKGPSAVIELTETIKKNQNLWEEIEEDVRSGTQNLKALTASADGIQLTSDRRKNSRHFANVMFNIMRGGIFDDNYNIEKADFSKFFSKANKNVFNSSKRVLDALPEKFSHQELMKLAGESKDKDFSRICFEYLPLKFSRRHGDPSRPWNKFSINTQNETDGSKILDYQGNWRDIFQNWEALAHSYPEYIESMIHKFLNASTFDGYNPYRVTKDGFDWEIIEPDDPWSYIGYWGDHQIIYLLKFLEFLENHKKGGLERLFNADLFVYANVPYKIKPYKDIIKNPKDTIEFDEKSDHEIRLKREQMGSDGALLFSSENEIYKVNFLEKILATVLSKVSNFIPEGGIWMNTQRPEWNDANNALVGNGVSMVTLYYMRRFLSFFQNLLHDSNLVEVSLSEELSHLFKGIMDTLINNEQVLSGPVSDQDRRKIMDGLGESASSFRAKIYSSGFSARKFNLDLEELKQFTKLALRYLDHSIRANKRTDDLYHAYNLMTVENENEVSISFLSEMLEGQVAALSSGFLSSEESLSVLDALRKSNLYRADQNSFILYPNKELPLFVNRNLIPAKAVEKSKLLQSLLHDGNREIIEKDVLGDFHFNGNFNNAESLKTALNGLDSKYDELVKAESNSLLKIFEEVFNHKAFTGRSGTFYGYEGLGSIYWHMVSKLAVAAQECCIEAIKNNNNKRLIGQLVEHYYEINEGIGVHKSPELYGAFPTDPYSHTPGGKGAQQPGMTGQVKEDILTRFGELGVRVLDGSVEFKPDLLQKNEFLKHEEAFSYLDLDFSPMEIPVPIGALAFTYCQVPILYHLSNEERIELHFKNESSKIISSLKLGKDFSQMLFQRTGEIEQIHVFVNK